MRCPTKKRFTRKNKKTLEVLIAVSDQYIDWAGADNRTISRTRGISVVHINVINIKSNKDLDEQLKFFRSEKRTFSAVALCPAHGTDTAEIKWSDSSFTEPTSDAINSVVLNKISKNIHICACFQGLFLGHFNKSCNLSGYLGVIGGSTPEQYQLKYIEAGCQTKNKFVKAGFRYQSYKK